jgi:hypothetical protein
MDKRIKKVFTQPNYALKAIFNRISPLIKDDETAVRINYFITTHKRLNLKNPQTFNEKLQWLKLHDQHPEYTQMVDKIEAKKIAAKMIGEEHIIPTLGVWDQFDDIDFDKLPNQFVLKCNHDSGGVVICRDKRKLDIEAARKKINRCLRRNPFWATREYPYKSIKPRILAEKFMVDESGTELKDYKFFCFNGKVKCLKVDFNRYIRHQANYFDKNLKLLPFGETVCPPDKNHHIEFPENINEMISLAEKMASNIPFIRIDLYNVCGKIFFGEMTFFPASGSGRFTSDEWDLKLGDYLHL